MKFNQGFSLLELVLAVAVFSISSVSLATLLIDANISTRLSLDRTSALFYAKEGLEAVRSIRDASSTVFFNLASGDYNLNNDSGWSFGVGSEVLDGKYTRVINITNTPGASPATSSKTVVSNVRWSLTTGRLASTTLTTILTNWRSN